MSLKPERLHAINDFSSLLNFLADELDWPIEPNTEPDGITFDYDADELKLSERAAAQLTVRQLQNFRTDQPWGIFLVEFNDAKLYRTALRQVLRGLVPNRRKDSSLKSWQHENLLFICATKDYRRFTFAHFRGDKLQTARLTTFGWQRGDTRLRTLCEFNLPALQWPEDGGADAAAWLKAWTKAFDKEPLTKDFFKRFDAAIEAVKTDLETYQQLPPAEAYTRSQLLLERLIFLYFLQNRGWLNQQRSFLLDHFNDHRQQPDEFTYYADFLEKLFWTLASPPGSAARLPGIPFLNGGLFDDDEFALTPVRRKHNPPLKIRNATFAKVFTDFLEAFNFTVREDTPLNQEVAVDPEMLGKVFESIILHAEAADPEAVAPDKRKATGSYYTPRIVVHFICQEALRQYLIAQLADGVRQAASLSRPDQQTNPPPTETPTSWQLVGQTSDQPFNERLSQLMKLDASDGIDESEMNRLRQLITPAEAARLKPLLRPKCCDPSVGSGAFPVGLLHELVNLRRLVEAAANGYVDPVRRPGTGWLHETKEDIIQNCLFGADIQQQAIEICQLRLWLSLVVDYDLGVDPFAADPEQFREAIARISQLPNLEMNFRRGDSLHDFICGVPLVIPPQQSFLNRGDFDAIAKLSQKLHKAKRAETKRKLRLEVLERRLDISQRVLETELKELQREEGQLTNRLFSDETASRANKRKRVEQEIANLQDALKKVAADRKQLDRLINHSSADSDFYRKLRKLEGADFDSPLNFSWPIDFAPVFAPRPIETGVTLRGQFDFVNQTAGQQTFVEQREEPGGFDLIVGNPPFVTARNPAKRELYRERWKRVCKGKYLLVCPFFELSFGLLRPGGQLGFIVSNAFAKREFGQPLIEDFFPTVDLQKVVDCSGLIFPGHGTPTCIVFGRNRKPEADSTIRVAATLPGGGDLRTPPEDSPLWTALEANHDQPGYLDSQIIVADRARKELAAHPWTFDSSGSNTFEALQDEGKTCLLKFIEGEVGVCTMTNADPIFINAPDRVRRYRIPQCFLRFFQQGESVRNWGLSSDEIIIVPYDERVEILPEEELHTQILLYLKPFQQLLENRVSFGNKTFKQLKRVWYSFERMNVNKYRTSQFITFCEIATHGHFVYWNQPRIFERDSPVIKLLSSATEKEHHLLTGLLNSTAALFWLKQLCFNKGAGEDEERDRFVYGGTKVQQLPVPAAVANALQGTSNSLAEALTEFSRACWERGQVMPSLALKKLFEQTGEAYQDWNAKLPGYVAPHAELANGFDSAESLRAASERAIALRETLRAEMIALQEEMDWLVYAAYGLIADSGLRIADYRLKREQRPFVLWAQAEGDFDRAVELIPAEWPAEQRELWRARLEMIRDNEHIRRIEQPVYKRRWDEQWKVGNRWQCGAAAYDAELIEAFTWWLAEKAEWWLEQSGRAIGFDDWASALWLEARIAAAWPVIAEAIHRLELWKWEQKKDSSRAPQPDASQKGFNKFFKSLVKEETVPAGIPFGVAYEKLKQPISAQVKKIRGKLNVPRERFWLTADGLYQVAAPFGSQTEKSEATETRPFA